MAAETFVTDLVGCARCEGEGHNGITFEPLLRPVEFDGVLVATHWALCPLTREPIMMLNDEIELPLKINGVEACHFIKHAYGLLPGGTPKFDLKDEVQTALRRIHGWVDMAQHDALYESRKLNEPA